MPVGRRVLKPIVVEPFHYSIYLAYGTEEYEYVARRRFPMEQRDLRPYEGLFVAMEDSEGTGFGFIFLQKGVEEGTIFHESLHAVHQCMDERGIPHGNANTELQAYLMEHIVGLLKAEIKKRGH